MEDSFDIPFASTYQQVVKNMRMIEWIMDHIIVANVYYIGDIPMIPSYQEDFTTVNVETGERSSINFDSIRLDTIEGGGWSPIDLDSIKMVTL